MAADVLFARAYRVILSGPKQSEGIAFGNQDASQSALRVSFEVKQGVADKPDSAKVVLYNLSRAQQSAICPGYRLQLRAGYQGLCDTIFFGTASSVTTERQGPDILTTISATDGQQALLTAWFSGNYPAGTKLYTILQDIAQAMGIMPGVVIGLPDYTLPRNQSFTCGARQALSDCLRRFGIDFYIRNNKLHMVPKSAHLGTAAVILSESSGLIGVPSLDATAGVKCTALLNPRLVPAQLVRIDSANLQVQGFCKVRAVTFKGDSHAQDWSAEIEAAQIAQSTVQTLKPAAGFAYGGAVVF